MSEEKKSLLPCSIVIVALTLLFFAPQYTNMVRGDAAFFLSSADFATKEIQSGRLPFWNPYLFSGQPFLANFQTGVFYPPNLIYFILPATAGYVFLVLANVCMAAIFMYCFARHNIRDDLAALFAGITFGFSALFLNRIVGGHMTVLNTLAWTPMVFLLFQRACEENKIKYKVYATFALTLAILGGALQYAFFIYVGIALFAVFLMVQGLLNRKPDHVLAVFRTALMVGGVAFLLAAFLILPVMTLTRLSIRGDGISFAEAASNSLYYHNLVMFLHPGYFGGLPDSVEWTGRGYFIEQCYYLGIAAFVFAIAALRKIRERSTLLFLLFAACGLLVSFGKFLPFGLYRLVFEFPIYNSMRFPVRHMFFFVFAAAGLAGVGLAMIKNRKLKTAVIVVACLDLFYFSSRLIAPSEPPAAPDPAVANTILKDEGRFRVLPLDGSIASRELQLGIASVSGYDGFMLRRYCYFVNGTLDIEPIDTRYSLSGTSLAFVENFNDKKFDCRGNFEALQKNVRLYDLLNVKYLTTGHRFTSPAYTPVSTGGRSKLYKRTAPAPRFYCTNNVVYAATAQELFRTLKKNMATISDIAVVTDGDHCFEKDTARLASRVEVTRYEHDVLEFTVDVSSKCFFVASEVYCPYWKAEVDGAERNIIPVNLVQRGLILEKGSHTVRMYYDKSTFYRGLTISVLTLLFFAVYSIILLMKERRTQ